MTSFVQKVLSKTVSYSIEDSGLLRKITSNNHESEFHFPFEQIKTNKVITLDHKKNFGIAGVICVILSVFVFFLSLSDKATDMRGALLYLIVAIILLVYYFVTRKTKMYLQTTENVTLEFVCTKANRPELDLFISEILEERNRYLISKYAKLTRNIEYGPQLENLNWLLNNRAITKTGYDDKVKELNSLFNNSSGSRPIGFTNTN